MRNITETTDLEVFWNFDIGRVGDDGRLDDVVDREIKSITSCESRLIG